MLVTLYISRFFFIAKKRKAVFKDLCFHTTNQWSANYENQITIKNNLDFLGVNQVLK
jgi:hypothetical protein